MNDLVTASVDETTTQYIVVNLGSEHFGINIRYIDNIVRVPSITRVPNVQPFFKGVINLRGEVIPVMNLRIKLGLSEIENTNKTRIIIIKLDPSAAIGIIVDEVEEVIDLTEEQIEKVTSDSKDDKAGYIHTVGKSEKGLISLLDLAAVIGEDK